MTPLFKKLNLPGDAEDVLVLNAPDSFETELAALANVAVKRNPVEVSGYRFALAFATRQSEVEELAGQLAAKADGDVVLWFAYPKGSSKRYRSEINRDNGWEALGVAGFEPVRQVAIDADWSALRFRKVHYIKKLTRNPSQALSATGKARAEKSRS